MTAHHLYRLSAFAAVTGGGLRIVTSFISYSPESVGLEALYALIDLSLLIAVIGLYLRTADRTGIPGLVGLFLSGTGFASIVGPDPVMLGMNFYALGTFLILTGISLFAFAVLATGAGSVPAAYLWLASSVLGPIGSLFPHATMTLMMAGILFGAGFVVAGLWLLRPTGHEGLRSA
ncbi:hypothetical protein [Kordiimonas aestuarii]|uniref:hypothetical protein n=1 Tax=Kordiimonas aestuarii TaxID=1005925 RepID=UPI0021CF62A5|nr:hypothetical protein [Kordiimonas aestuarii]